MAPAVVFVGPSLPAAREILADATFRPPASRGMIQQAANSGFGVILLIDGLMVHNYAPSPQEIADVMSSGVTVVGAGSLGALRAVELRHQGMVGLGWVYGAYLGGLTDADVEVLSLCEPSGWRPLTVPAIRIRYALEALVHERRINADQAHTCMRTVSTCYFENRTPGTVLQAAQRAGMADALGRELLHPRYDVKRHDALLALQWVGRRMQDQ